MAGEFAKSLRRVSAVHVGLLLLVVGTPSLSSLFRRPELQVPVEFMVEVPQPEGREREAPAVQPEPEPAKPEDDVIPEPVKKPPKKGIEKSTTRVVRDVRGTRRPTLSEAEIRRLLALGAMPGDHTSIPGEEQRCLEWIRRRLYEAWAQPSAAEMGDSVVEVRISLLPGGRIGDRKLVSGSGKAAVDASAMDAANLVTEIPGLSADFLQRYRNVTVAFRLDSSQAAR